MARDNELSFIISIQDQASKRVRALEQTIGRLNKTVSTNVQVKVTADDRPFRHMQTQAKNMEKQWAKTSAALNKKPPDDLSAWSRNITNNLKAVGSVAATTGKIIGAAFGVSMAVAIAGVGIALVKYGKQAIEINSQFETFQTSLRTTLGSLGAAKKEMMNIIEFARVTPYEIAGVTDAFVKLRAYALDPNKWATAAGDMAAAFGKPMIKAVEAIADATRGEFKRMREFGFVFHINDFKKGGQYAGKTYADAIFDAISGRFKGGMALQAQTYSGIVSNLKDTITIALAEAGKPIFAYVKRSASGLLAYFDALKESGALDSYIAKFKRIFQEAQESIAGVVEYIKRSWIPLIKSTIKNSMELAGSIIDAFGPTILRAVLGLITLILTLIDTILKAANAGKELIKIYVGFKIISSIFKLIGINAIGATKAVIAFGAGSKEAGAASAAAAKRIGIMAAAVIALAAFGKSAEFKSSINEVTKNLNGMIDTATAKKNAEELGKTTGRSMAEIAKGMAVASEYGSKYLEITRVAAKEADTFGMSLEDTVRMLGDLGKAFGVTGGEYERFSAYVYDLIDAGKEFNFDSDQLLDTLKEYPEVLHGVAGGYETMIAMAKEAGKQHQDLGKILAAGDLMRTPSKEMLIGGEGSAGEHFSGLNPTAWVTRSINDAADFSKAWDTAFEKDADKIQQVNTQANTLRETLVSLSTDPTLQTTGIAKAMAGETSDFIKVIGVLRELDSEERRLMEEQKRLQESIATQTTALGDLQEAEWQASHATQQLALTQLKLRNAVNEVTPSIGDMALSIKKLNLKSLEIDLKLSTREFRDQEKAIKKLSSAVKVQERELSAMNRALKEDEKALKPLNDELKSLEEQFTAISDSIQKAQSDLDKFTHPKLEGMGAFDDQIHNIDMQLQKLERQRLDEKSGLDVWERLGLTDTDAYKRASAGLVALDKQIGILEDSKSRLELDKSIAYDDQLYQLGKIADTEKEITFAEAVAGAKKAKEQVTLLSDQLERVGNSKSVLTEEINLRQQSIDKQQTIIDSKEYEIELQKDLIATRQDELDASQEILQNAKDDLDYEKERLSTLIQIKELQNDIASDVQRRQDEIGSAERALAISEQAHQLELTQQAVDENSNQLTKVTEATKTLTSAIEALIIGIDFKNLSESQSKALEQTFGKDFVTDMIRKAMAATGEQQVNQPPTTGGYLDRGIVNTIKTMFSDMASQHPILTSILGGGAGYGIAKGGGAAIRGAGSAIKRGVTDPLARFGQGALTQSVPEIRGGISQLQYGFRGGMNESLKKVDDIIKYTSTNDKAMRGMTSMAEEYLDDLSKAVDDIDKIVKPKSLAERAGRWFANILPERGRQFIEGTAQTHVMGMNARNLQATAAGLAEDASPAVKKAAKKAAKEASEEVMRQPFFRRLVVGAGANIPFISKPARQLAGALTGSGGSAVSRVRAAEYSSARLLGIGQHVLSGEGASAGIRQLKGVIAGKTISGQNVLSKLNPLKWGEGGAASIDALTGGMGGLPERIGELIPKIKTAASEIPKVMRKALTTGVKFGLGSVLDIGLGSYDLQKIIRKIPGWDEFFSSDKNPLVKGMDVLFSVFGDSFGKVFLELTDPVAAAANVLEQLILTIEGVIEVVVNFVFGVGKSLIDFFKALFSWNWDDFGQKIKDNFAAVGEALGKTWEHMKSFWSFLKETWAEVKELLMWPFEKAWEWLSSESGVAGWAGKIWGFISNLGSILKGKIGDITGWFSNLFSGAWKWLTGPDGPRSWPGKIADWIASIPGKIADLGGMFVDAGKAIINKLIEGMQFAWNLVKDAPVIKQIAWVVEKGGNVLGGALNAVGFAEGGISRGPASGYNAVLHGTEAVIPLKSGYIPVKITGDSGQQRVTNIQSGAFNIVVRNDEDMEEVKKILLSIQQGTFVDSPYNYPQGT